VIKPYWLSIITEIHSILGFEIPNSFDGIYLANIPVECSVRDKYLLKILLTASKKAITKKWLVKDPPTKGEWINIVNDLFRMERLTFSLRLCSEKSDNYWSKWVLHMKREVT